VNAFRYGFLGVSDIDIRVAYAIIFVFIGLLGSISLYILHKGIGLRS